MCAWLSPSAELPTDYLADFLMELDQVIQDFNQGAPSSLSSSRQYEQHLEERKRRTGRSSYDRGIDDPESKQGLLTPLQRWGKSLLSPRVGVGFMVKSCAWHDRQAQLPRS